MDASSDILGFRDAYFTWTDEGDSSQTAGNDARRFSLRIDGDLLFERGCINLIVGPTGTGKTSMLMALLGATPKLF